MEKWVPEAERAEAGRKVFSLSRAFRNKNQVARKNKLNLKKNSGE